MALANFTQVNGTISIDEMLDRSGTNWNVVKKPLVTEEGWTTGSETVGEPLDVGGLGPQQANSFGPGHFPKTKEVVHCFEASFDLQIPSP